MEEFAGKQNHFNCIVHNGKKVKNHYLTLQKVIENLGSKVFLDFGGGLRTKELINGECVLDSLNDLQGLKATIA
jgi:hypothetical protein